MNVLSNLKTKMKNKLLQYYAGRGIVLQQLRFGGSDLDGYFNSIYQRTYPHEVLENRLFYNIGAGRFRHHYWTNVDLRMGSLSSQWDVNDINFDISANQSLPLQDGHAEIIYTSHVIEHVNDDSVACLLAECYRVLRHGGCIRVVCPDVDLAKMAYNNKDQAFFEGFYGEAIPSMAHGLARFVATECVIPEAPGYMEDGEICNLLISKPDQEWLTYLTKRCGGDYQRLHPDNHINWFNSEKLLQMLRKAGFREVYRSGYGQSANSVLRDIRNFDCTLPFMSLFVEARK